MDAYCTSLWPSYPRRWYSTQEVIKFTFFRCVVSTLSNAIQQKPTKCDRVQYGVRPWYRTVALGEAVFRDSGNNNEKMPRTLKHYHSCSTYAMLFMPKYITVLCCAVAPGTAWIRDSLAVQWTSSQTYIAAGTVFETQATTTRYRDTTAPR